MQSAPSDGPGPSEPASRGPAPGGGPPRPTALARFAWPLAFTATVAMVLVFLRTAPRSSDGASEVRVEHSGATVVRDLRALARLETAALHVEKVIDVRDHQKRLGGLLDADDALLFVAAGDVVLGVDFTKIGEDDVRADRATGTVHITLPPPEVLSTRLDEARSFVHSRSTDLLATRNEALESAARKDALAAFEAAGREPHALELARRSAETHVRAFARTLGTRDVVVAWKDAEPSGPR